MRIVYFITMILLVMNLLVVIMSGLTGINIYKKYSKQIIKGIFQFLFILLAILVALYISGLT